MQSGEEEIEEQFQLEAIRRRHRLLSVVLPVIAGLLGCQYLLSFLVPQSVSLLLHLIFLPMLALIGLCYALHRKQRDWSASWILNGALFILATLIVWLFGGLSRELGVTYVVVVMTASATLGVRAAAVFTGLSVLASAGVLVAELRGWLPEPLAETTVVSAWLNLTGTLLTVSLFIYLMMTSMSRMMKQSLRVMRERDAARLRYIQAQKMEPMGRLASGVAHDFNNLLTVIAGVSSLLRKRGHDPQLMESLLDDLDSATARAGMMTGQLLAFARARPEERKLLRVAEVLRSITPLLMRLVGEDVEVQLEIKQENARIWADRSQLEQVLLNLVVNARDAMPEGGTLRLSLERAERPHHVKISVEDTGLGMDEELTHKVFAPFFTTKQKGTGLGLATVYDIVRQHQGQVQLESQLGRGTRFDIIFPVRDAPESVRPASLKEEKSVRAGRVLLVEDHELVRRTNRRTLEQAGFDVTAVLDGAEALSLVEAGAPIDVIVTDLMMPRMSGVDFAHRLQSGGARTPVLFVSGHYAALPEELKRLNYTVEFLRKPFSSVEFLEAVRSLLEDATTDSGERHNLGSA